MDVRALSTNIAKVSEGNDKKGHEKGYSGG